ncbi:hypothetical protein V6N13_116766 [Hibiscus sabdariffa]
MSTGSKCLLGGLLGEEQGASVRFQNPLNFPCLSLSWAIVRIAIPFFCLFLKSALTPGSARVGLRRILADPAWCFASDDWYGVWESSVSVFSVDAVGLFVWFFTGDKMEESDDGLIACGVVIGRCYIEALLWGTLKLRLGRVNLNEGLSGSMGCRIRAMLTGGILIGWRTVNREVGLPIWLDLVAESGSFSNFGFISLVMERQGCLAERSVVVCYLGDGCLVAGLRLGNYQRVVGLGIGGRLVVGCFVFSVLKGVWSWWREFSDSEGEWTWPRGSLWCALQGVWMCLWWRYRRKRVRISSLKGFEWWLWRFPRGSTTESTGRGEAAGEDVGKFGFSCMTWMERACTWGLPREVLGPTGEVILRVCCAEGDIPLGGRSDRYGRGSDLAKWRSRETSMFNDTVRFG